MHSPPPLQHFNEQAYAHSQAPLHHFNQSHRSPAPSQQQLHAQSPAALQNLISDPPASDDSDSDSNADADADANNKMAVDDSDELEYLPPANAPADADSDDSEIEFQSGQTVDLESLNGVNGIFQPLSSTLENLKPFRQTRPNVPSPGQSKNKPPSQAQSKNKPPTQAHSKKKLPTQSDKTKLKRKLNNKESTEETSSATPLPPIAQSSSKTKDNKNSLAQAFALASSDKLRAFEKANEWERKHESKKLKSEAYRASQELLWAQEKFALERQDRSEARRLELMEKWSSQGKTVAEMEMLFRLMTAPATPLAKE
ncbi:hypothetical protein DFH28DRAFT_1160968 [Melampsora americana]|nr:hypothetical protein DFH28DRAFT_1160968 [Melampsora americana]